MQPTSRVLMAGAVAGLTAALCFAAAHALLIVPIWDRMLGGAVGASVAGMAAGWACLELRIAPGWSAGARFGGLLWLLVAPVTLVDSLLRLAGVHRRFELAAVAVAVVVAFASGWLYGQRRSGTRRAAIATAVATLVLTIAMSGPVPIANGLRALGIWLAVLPASVVAGAVLGRLATSD